MAGREQGDLLLDLADVIVAAFEIDVFDRDGLAGAFVQSAVYDTEGAAWEGDVRGELWKENDGCEGWNLLPSSSSIW